MYVLELRIEMKNILLPGKLTSLDQVEAVLEAIIADALEPHVSDMTIQAVNLSEQERDWDALLQQL